MKVKVSRTTRPLPGETRGFKSETLFTYLEIDPNLLQLLIDLKPAQMIPMHISAEEDCRWAIKNALMFHTVVKSLACQGHPRQEIRRFVDLTDLMKGYLTDDWELSWSTLEDMTLEIYNEFQEVEW
jgi:hypothetical protein